MRDTNWWRIIFTSLPNYRHVEVELDSSGFLNQSRSNNVVSGDLICHLLIPKI